MKQSSFARMDDKEQEHLNSEKEVKSRERRMVHEWNKLVIKVVSAMKETLKGDAPKSRDNEKRKQRRLERERQTREKKKI